MSFPWRRQQPGGRGRNPQPPSPERDCSEGRGGRMDLRRDWVSSDPKERWETQMMEIRRGYREMARGPGQDWESLLTHWAGPANTS